MAERLLRGIELTPGQLAQVRAIDAKYQTGLAALKRGGTGDEESLRARMVHDLREMLTPEQCVVLDGNSARRS